MGLDKYKDKVDDSSSGNSSSSSSNDSDSSSSDNSPTTSFDNDPVEESDLTFYGSTEANARDEEFVKEGIMKDVDMVELTSQASGKLEVGGDYVKYHLPSFYEVRAEHDFDAGKRYQLVCTKDMHPPSWHGRVVTCVGSHFCTLGELTKETAMFDTSKFMKDEAMDELNQKLGDNVNPDMSVLIHFFIDSMHIRNIVQRAEEQKSGDLVNRDDIIHHILFPNKQ